jgi:cell division protease FtsH
MTDRGSNLAADFIAIIRAALDQEAAQKPTEEPYFRQRLTDHFGTDPATLPVVRETVPSHDHPNLHRALQTVLAAHDRAAELLGIATRHGHSEVSLSQMILPTAGRWGGSDLYLGPVRYLNIMLHDEQVLACLHTGLFLVSAGDERLAVLVRGPSEEGWGDRSTHIQVMAREQAIAAALLAEIRAAMRRENVYRGRIISLVGARGNELVITFHRLPPVARSGIILPAAVLAAIERETIVFTRHAERLRAAGRHLKRGVAAHPA